MSNLPTAFELSDSEKAHPLWLRLKDHLEAHLVSLRARNDNPQQTEAETAALRGNISCLKWIIALGNDRPSTD